MKKYFEYIGLLAFALLSFYYTDKVTQLMNSKDPIMISINEYKEKEKAPCKEGYITSEGVVLGRNGKEVDALQSYSNMQGKNFDESLLVFNEIACKVSLETSLSDFIINANPSKNLVSVFIKVQSLDYMNEIIGIFEEKHLQTNLIITGKMLNENKEYFLSLYNKGYELIYNGASESDYMLFKKTLKEMSEKSKPICISLEGEELKFCQKDKSIRLKTEYFYNKNILLNTKKNLEKGSFIVYKENKNAVDEMSSTINYIKGKNLEIVTISKALK